MKIWIKEEYKPQYELLLEEAISRVRCGQINEMTTLAWYSGKAEWFPLSELVPPAIPDNPKVEKYPPCEIDLDPRWFHSFMPIGRRCRKAYFGWNIFSFLLMVPPFLVAQIVRDYIGSRSLAYFICGVSMMFLIYFLFINTVKRLHDTGISGWFFFIRLIPIIGLLLWVIPGTKGPNQYGKNDDCRI